MTSEQWLAKAEQNQTKLRMLIEVYHPVNGKDHEFSNTFIAAESACEGIRRSIRKDSEGEFGTENRFPIMEFDQALKAKDISKINSILNECWFGVPESTTCWKIPGFKEAVELLEDPPED